MWWTMQEAEEPQRLLQNHLDVPQHCTTQAGLWMPQYTHLYSTAQCTLCLQYRYVYSVMYCTARTRGSAGPSRRTLLPPRDTVSVCVRERKRERERERERERGRQSELARARARERERDRAPHDVAPQTEAPPPPYYRTQPPPRCPLPPPRPIHNGSMTGNETHTHTHTHTHTQRTHLITVPPVTAFCDWLWLCQGQFCKLGCTLRPGGLSACVERGGGKQRNASERATHTHTHTHTHTQHSTEVTQDVYVSAGLERIRPHARAHTVLTCCGEFFL